MKFREGTKQGRTESALTGKIPSDKNSAEKNISEVMVLDHLSGFAWHGKKKNKEEMIPSPGGGRGVNFIDWCVRVRVHSSVHTLQLCVIFSSLLKRAYGIIVLCVFPSVHPSIHPWVSQWTRVEILLSRLYSELLTLCVIFVKIINKGKNISRGHIGLWTSFGRSMVPWRK